MNFLICDLLCPAPRLGGLKRWCASDVCLIAYIRPESRTERSRETKIGIEVAHVTGDSDTTFKVKGQLVGILWWPPAQLVKQAVSEVHTAVHVSLLNFCCCAQFDVLVTVMENMSWMKKWSHETWNILSELYLDLHHFTMTLYDQSIHQFIFADKYKQVNVKVHLQGEWKKRGDSLLSPFTHNILLYF